MLQVTTKDRDSWFQGAAAVRLWGFPGRLHRLLLGTPRGGQAGTL